MNSAIVTKMEIPTAEVVGSLSREEELYRELVTDFEYLASLLMEEAADMLLAIYEGIAPLSSPAWRRGVRRLAHRLRHHLPLILSVAPAPGYAALWTLYRHWTRSCDDLGICLLGFAGSLDKKNQSLDEKVTPTHRSFLKASNEYTERRLLFCHLPLFEDAGWRF